MRTDMCRQTWVLALAMVGMLLGGGCGKKLATVEGNVTWEGKPVDSGSISFTPADGKGPSVGAEIKDGKYELAGQSGVTGGKNTVTITAVRKTGKKVEAGSPAPPGTMVDDVETLSSTQTCEISDGKTNQQNFDVKPAAKP